MPLSVSLILRVRLSFIVYIIPPAPTLSARAEAAGLRPQASAHGAPPHHIVSSRSFHSSFVPAIRYIVIHWALPPCAASGASPTRSRRRGPLGATQSPSRVLVSDHTPRKSPPSHFYDVPSERSRGPPPSSEKNRRAFSWQSRWQRARAHWGCHAKPKRGSIAPRPYVLHAT